MLHLEDDEEGEEDQHKEQQAAGVQRKEVILVWEIWLRKPKEQCWMVKVLTYVFSSHQLQSFT